MANTCISATAETALTGVAKADAATMTEIAAIMTEIAAIITDTMEDAATETATNAERMNKGA